MTHVEQFIFHYQDEEVWGQINQNEQGNNCSSHDTILNMKVMKETQFKERIFYWWA